MWRGCRFGKRKERRYFHYFTRLFPPPYAGMNWPMSLGATMPTLYPQLQTFDFSSKRRLSIFLQVLFFRPCFLALSLAKIKANISFLLRFSTSLLFLSPRPLVPPTTPYPWFLVAITIPSTFCSMDQRDCRNIVSHHVSTSHVISGRPPQCFFLPAMASEEKKNPKKKKKK